MKRMIIAGSIVVLAAIAAVLITAAPSAAMHTDQAAISCDQSAPTGAASSCAEKNCPANARCCYSCTGNPICVRNSQRCPECAPQ
jgi:hypothetical protein